MTVMYRAEKCFVMRKLAGPSRFLPLLVCPQGLAANRDIWRAKQKTEAFINGILCNDDLCLNPHAEKVTARGGTSPLRFEPS